MSGEAAAACSRGRKPTELNRRDVSKAAKRESNPPHRPEHLHRTRLSTLHGEPRTGECDTRRAVAASRLNGRQGEPGSAGWRPRLHALAASRLKIRVGVGERMAPGSWDWHNRCNWPAAKPQQHVAVGASPRNRIVVTSPKPRSGGSNPEVRHGRVTKLTYHIHG
jgi:hypothetical protein